MGVWRLFRRRESPPVVPGAPPIITGLPLPFAGGGRRLLPDIRGHPDLHLRLESLLGHVDDAAFFLLGEKHDAAR